MNDAGFNTDGLIFVDERAHLVLDKHIEEDSSESKIGTTRQGIGPTYRDKYNRTGMRMKDLGTQPSSLFSVIDIYELFHNKNNEKCFGRSKSNIPDSAFGFRVVFSARSKRIIWNKLKDIKIIRGMHENFG